MPRVRLTRIVRFSAAHRYFRPDWSQERNREVFGACAGEHGHGHNYECAVTVAGPLDPDTGMVINLAEFDRILREEIRDPFDHRFINHEVAAFGPGRLIPTGESLAVYLWERIAARLPTPVVLEHLRVQEDRDLYAEYSGEEDA
jgi:6-pyruvoyltetrahydropterin/6-carboxytetrahydropterin synthase